MADRAPISPASGGAVRDTSATIPSPEVSESSSITYHGGARAAAPPSTSPSATSATVPCPEPGIRVKRRLKRGGKQFVKFAIVGGIGTAVNLAVLKIALLTWGHASTTTPLTVEIAASALAFMVAVVNNFLFNRWWTFRSTGPAHVEFGKFLTVSLAGLALNTLAFSLFRGHLALPVLLSQLLAIGCVLPFNFLVNKFWSFRSA